MFISWYFIQVLILNVPTESFHLIIWCFFNPLLRPLKYYVYVSFTLKCWRVEFVDLDKEEENLPGDYFQGRMDQQGWLDGQKGIVGNQLYITAKFCVSCDEASECETFHLTCCDRAWIPVSCHECVSFLTNMFCILQINCFILYSELSYTYFCNKVLT